MAASSVKAAMDSAIADNKVFVVSKSFCPFCTKAKTALSSLTSDYTVMEIDGDRNMAAIQDYMKDITGARSVPRVFIGGEFLGGGSETEAALANGTLKAKLTAAGVTLKK